MKHTLRKLTLYGYVGEELDVEGQHEFIVVYVGPNKDEDWEGELCTKLEWLED